MLCLKHLPNIKGALGISGVLTNVSGWIYKAPRGSKERGVQIDLLIDRADNCINLCEIKYANEEFTISKSYDKELREKKGAFISHSKTKKAYSSRSLHLMELRKMQAILRQWRRL